MVICRLLFRRAMIFFVSKSCAMKASFPLFLANSSQLKISGKFSKFSFKLKAFSCLCTVETETWRRFAMSELVCFSMRSWVIFAQAGCEIWQCFLTRLVLATETLRHTLHWKRRFLSLPCLGRLRLGWEQVFESRISSSSLDNEDRLERGNPARLLSQCETCAPVL